MEERCLGVWGSWSTMPEHHALPLLLPLLQALLWPSSAPDGVPSGVLVPSQLPTMSVLLRWGQMPPPPSLCLETVGCDPSHFTVLCFPFVFPSRIHSLAPATCRTGKTLFAQALLSTSGIHFLPVPSLLRCWRHILPFTFTPRAAGLWLGQDVTVGVPSCCTVPGRVDRHWGHHCHPKGTLLLALPQSSLVLGPSHLPAFSFSEVTRVTCALIGH